MTRQTFDVIVIGSGPAGGIVARRLGDAGLDVAVVEKDGWGGVCPLRGCEPKKTLADMAHEVVRVRDMAAHGVAGTVRVDWSALMRYKHSVIDPIAGRVFDSFHGRGITTFHGRARFTGPDTVEVDDLGPLTARHIVVAAGAVTRPLGIPGEELLLTSDQFLDLETLPESMLFIGGGFISFEFACIAAAAGARATILHRSGRVLRGFDEHLGHKLIRAMQDQGIAVHVDHPVKAVMPFDDGVRVVVNGPDDVEMEFVAAAAVTGAGRVPDLDGLGLDKAGVDSGPHGIRVDEYMRSPTNPVVYAAGDCAEPGHSLTPVAALQADTVVRNILEEGSARSDLRGTAGAVFTHPVLACAGLLEEQAREQGYDFKVYEGDAAKWAEHARLGMTHAGYRILVERSTGRILGAHYLGAHAEEVANIFGLAIRYNLTREDLLAQPWAYPSFGYAVRYMLG
ncbi:FAD-dependent pyridine nucleotide-disulfide oxidoreductase [Pseudodesulfovibrio mercurii]|uniref:FAD-dependent pyridine nucleotide-disulfide oxidoreductase n=1 Tax=Pseudodesulfovibrio mercurii TaxID=641491 RepID=F0JBY4_9BACT|nr:NAD(P)/FAD-dependent oxidoreductase [Pseudodesulfovibrio mercurii]EGB14377.1 FAD-dependent pyridine nucleotide-disulfide oxidoreductase [Pseudodesulfovibrio mercurii]